MRAKMVNILHGNRKDISRLSVGVILVACMAVAGLATFTGFSDEGDVAIYSGPGESSTLELRGAVIARGDAQVNEIAFIVAIPADGEPVIFTTPPDNVVVLSYTDNSQRIDDIAWEVADWGLTDDGDNILEAGENFRITVPMDALPTGLGPVTTFAIDVRTPDGGVLAIERTTPDELTPVMNLH